MDGGMLMRYVKPNMAVYRMAQGVCWLVAKMVFRRKILRNEIRGKQGPFVVIANHQCMLDFVNLIGMTPRPMTFVLSKSFFSTMPIQGILKKMGVIPKQQFQTTVADMKKMKAVVDHGQPLVIYPAGLMCEDGLSTPVPKATYKFLKWMNVDVYMARTRGTYFVMPKWSKKIRPGVTTMDVTLLFTKEELATLTPEQIQARTDAVLLYDAYEEQAADPQRYAGCADIRGLEHVLYRCPHCGEEFSMEVADKSVIRCNACGFTQTMDDWGFFHCDDKSKEIRHVSDWSKRIYGQVQKRIAAAPSLELCADSRFQMVDEKKHKMVDVGEGQICLKRGSIHLSGTMHGQPADLDISIVGIPTLPFSPGRYLEVQQGETIYRCVLHDGRLVMKFLNHIKCFHALEQQHLNAVK